MAKNNVWTYQYGEYKIEIKPTFGNFEVYVNGEVQATTKGKISFHASTDTHLTATLPSGEELLAIRRVTLKEDDIVLFVGQQLTPQ